MQFSQQLDILMKERAISSYRLAKMMDISQSTVSHWLAGETNPQRGTLRRLSETLNVPIEYFTDAKKDLPLGLSSKPVEFDVDRLTANYDDGLTEKQRDLINLVAELPDNVVSLLLSAAKDWLKNQQSSDSV